MGTLSATSCLQADLVTFLTAAQTLLNEFKTDFNATLTKLDSDTLVGDTNYNSTLALSDTALAIASVGSRGGIVWSGIHQEDLATFLTSVKTFANNAKAGIAALNAKLDADSGVSGTDYASLWDCASAALDVSKLTGTGISWGPDLWDFVQAVKTLLNEIKTNYAGILAKLDLDAGVTDTNYAATNPLSAAALSYTV